MLDLHLVQEDVAVLGKLDLAGTPNEHFERATRTEIGLQNALQPSRRSHVDGPRSRL